jgi:hypothetical protein
VAITHSTLISCIENISAKYGFDLNIKDCQSILKEVVSTDRTKNNNKMAKLSN